MASRIERLPVELFELIAASLELPSYKTLRLASQRLCFLLHSLFVERAFSRLSTTLGSPSLDRLLSVSRCENLRGAVKVLQIQLLTSSDYHTLAAISRVGRFPPPKRFPRVPGIKDRHIHDEATTLKYVLESTYPTRLYDGLVRALRGFTNLEAVHFYPSNDQPTGRRRRLISEDDRLFRSRCFQVVIDAIVQAHVRLLEFRMAKCRRGTVLHKEAALPFSVLHMPAESLQALCHCFSHLQTLTVSVLTVSDDVSRLTGWQKWLVSIVATAPRLRSLTLSLDRSAYVASAIRNLVSSCTLLELEILQLMFCALHGDDLATIIKNHSTTLRRAIFSDLRLVTGSWSSILHALKECKKLEYVRLSSLSEEHHPIQRLDIRRHNHAMAAMLEEIIVSYDTQGDNSASQSSGFVEPHHITGLSLANLREGLSTTVPSE
ncbi:EEF1A lysine methyltransferase 2 [Alternaria panax]|uniref:EEF1A lysine methyltransferase 2 n=1 Tax=Alternaria panax TaxID=48097 RepID=A0AAD4IA60_9PLEO|nr:EEF1A lysine methyltransferase 2 [Alternaria panax]